MFQSNLTKFFLYSVAKPQAKPFFSRTKIAFTLACGLSYFGYRQGRERYKQMHFANMYEQFPDTEPLGSYIGIFRYSKRLEAHILPENYQIFSSIAKEDLPDSQILSPGCLITIRTTIQKVAFWPLASIYALYTANGPLWIKLGQWASHRGDIFGEDITRSLEHLRDHAPPHSAKETHKEFKKEFGKDIYEVFEFFNDQPVASGSIAQIHKARLNGENVAIKVRHPNIITNLEMDITILYSWVNFISQTLGLMKSIAMPVTFDEFKRTLVSQTDLRLEARSLKLFNEKFEKNPHVIFPRPIEPYISASILTETFEEGIPLTKFITQERTPEHYRIANLGLKTFYKMLIYDNFIHADCHAGNIFVRFKDQKLYDNLSFWEKTNRWVEAVQDKIYAQVEKYIEVLLTKVAEWNQGTSSENLKEDVNVLSVEQKSDEASYTSFLKLNQENSKEVELILLDPGMVTILNKQDRISFIKLVMYITLRRPIECGYLMLQLAQYNDKRKIDLKTQEKFLREMQLLFEGLCKVPLSKMNIGHVLRSMLEILRANGMSIEGHFAALLTNMIVLEGVVKELDPDINIVAKAASFLLHLKTIDKTIDEIITQAL